MAGGAATSAGVSQGSGSNGDDATAISPYETNPDNIPQDDPFLKQSPHYGRYAPRDDDFKPRYDHWWQSDPDAISHWENIVKENLSPENSLNLQEGRQAHSVGSVIIRVDKDDVADTTAERYSCANANELSAARKAEDALKALDITVPVIHFCGTVDGKNVTVESRIPGVSLEVAWRYLSTEQINKFKQECRQILEHMASIDPAPDSPSYVCSGLNSQLPPEIQEMEKDVLFQEKMEDEILCLVHNNMTPSNIIVNDDRVVGIIGWRHSGYFGFRRANTIHRRFRMPTWSSLEAAGGNVEAWADIYENLLNAKVGSKLEASQDTPGPQVKTEPSNVTLDKVPENDEIDNKSITSQLDGVNTPGEHPTPKKIADLKHGRGSRASSSDRSSPANSVKAASGRKSTPGGSKKGTAKKSTAKKRKITEEDTESVDGHQSNTPSSRTSKTPGVKKQGSASVAGSPAPESRTKRKKGTKKRKAPKKAAAKEEEHEEGEGEEEEEASTDENELFCICRKPDNHTWMIACDGECDDWFHGKCVNIDPKDADLIDKYICPNCKEKGKGCTTWKPMCRVPSCRKPARFNNNILSKYCSDEHGREFMRLKTQYLKMSPAPENKMEDLGSRGGILTAGDLKAVIMDVSSAAEFRKLGERIVSLPPDDPETDTKEKDKKKLGLDFAPDDLTYSPDEESKIEELRKRRDELLHRRDMLNARNTFVNLVRQRSKSVLERLKQAEPKGGWKDICGFDSRLAWSDEEFDEWRLSEVGAKTLEDGTPEALASSYPDTTDIDGDTVMNGVKAEEDDISSLSRGICTKKRCERHKQWVKVQQQEILFEEDTVNQDLAKCEKEAQNVVERAILRMWAEKENAQNGCQ
ncbi:hypothetical protein BDV33DRAFT_151139 [Aspergillus novoparasiticus]|uniref:PHD-type domain-containing protein n=1 Tax=Aspergillus novoparasiticus TaxID=986946 RepID=A0A5N6EIG9_9EURO|nr:hypothetical protein BDV33DRAFT_151139 [Aspergillus novoparasiticus]